MSWSDEFSVGSDQYSVSAEIAPRNDTDSTALLFTVRRDSGAQAYPVWNITFRLTGPEAVSVKKAEPPTEWIWRQGYEIIKRSAERGCLREGEFLLSPSYLSVFENATLADIEQL